MKTIIDWIDPKEKTPPFNERILVLLGGKVSTDFMRTWNKYATIMDAIITTHSPNDDSDESEEYAEFEAEVNMLTAFSDYQFFVHSWYQFKYELFIDDDDASDWFSDEILRWATIPDFGEAIESVKAGKS